MAKHDANPIAINGDLDQLLRLVSHINSLALATQIILSGDAIANGPARETVIHDLIATIDNLSLQAGAHVEYLDQRRAA